MNPTVPKYVIEKENERDPSRAAAEYGANFRSDIESYISVEVVDSLVENGVAVRAPGPETTLVEYNAFVDPSGGSSDSMTLAITHEEENRYVLDAVLERIPPFSPESVVREFSAILKSYHISVVTGDRYAGEWPRERFRVHNIEYEVAAKTKSDIYRDLLPLLNSGRIALLDHPRLIAQLCNLERRTARGGRDSIDHPPGAHDDLANAVAGALVTKAIPIQQGVVWGTKREFPRGFLANFQIKHY
jgi:hypothetical protein